MHVPYAFSLGAIVPVPKDTKKRNIENFRPITSMSVISKLFESTLLKMYSKYFLTSGLQFGFKEAWVAEMQYFFCVR